MHGHSKDCQPGAPRGGKIWLKLLRFLALLCRFALAAVFLMAAITKFSDLPAFKDYLLLHTSVPESIAWMMHWLPHQLAAHLTPGNVANALAHFLPCLELTCGACLALGYGVREAGLFTAILLALFLAHSLIHFQETDCRCFLLPGMQSRPQPAWLAARNAVLLSANVFMIAMCIRKKRPGSIPSD